MEVKGNKRTGEGPPRCHPNYGEKYEHKINDLRKVVRLLFGHFRRLFAATSRIYTAIVAKTKANKNKKKGENAKCSLFILLYAGLHY